MRSRFRAIGFVALAIVAITCTDAPTGPGSKSVSPASLRLNPSFSSEAARVYGNLAAFGIEVTEVHVHLTGADGTVRDTVISFPPGQDEITIEIPVAGSSTDQPFNAVVELRNDAHTVLFSGTQTVTARPTSAPATTGATITIQYAGPGKGTKTVSIAPNDTTVPASATVNYSATAIDSSNAAVTNLLVLWTASDVSVASVTQTSNTTASVAGTGKRGVITLTARTPQGVAGTARISFVPPASKIVLISGGGQTAAAGSTLPLPMVVEVQATDNQPVPGIPVSFRAVSAGGTVVTASAVSDANGRASANLKLGPTAGSYQYEASSGTLTVATATETATPAPASAIAVASGNNQSDSIGRALAQPLVVKVTDQFGGNVSGATVSWTKFSGAGTLASASTVTGADGTSSNTYTLGSTIGTDTIRASVANVTGFAQFIERATSRNPSAIVIVSGGAQTGVAGTALANPLIVRVNDVLGNALSGMSVAFTVAEGAATFNPATGVTGANGQLSTAITLGLAPGVVPVTATVGTLQVSTSMTVTPATPATVTKLAGDNQSALVNATVAVAPSVLVKDALGNPAQGIPVTFAVASGGGSVTGATAITATNGIATVGSWKLGTASGANTLTATAGSVSATFSATGTSASATKFTVVQGPAANITVGAAIPAIKVQIADASGNPVAQSGVSVQLTGTVTTNNADAAATGGPAPAAESEMLAGTFGATATTDAAGVATLTLSPYVGAIGSASIAVTSAGLTTLTFPSIPVLAGAASQLMSVTTVSTPVPNSQAFSTQPIVQLRDAGGNNVAQSGVSVTAAIQSGTGTLNGTKVATTNANGTAFFTGLSITGSAGPFVLVFTAPSLASATSNSIALVAGAVVTLNKNAGDNQTAPAGSTLAVNPSVLVVDASGNPVSGVNVTFAPASGSGSVTGAAAVTDANGIATVGSWTIGNTPGSNSLVATAGVFTYTFHANGMLGAASKLAPVSPVPTTIHVGDPITSFAVRLVDAANNPVPQAGVSVHYSATVTVGTQSQTKDTTVVTDANGIAPFFDQSYDGPAGTLSFSATSPGITTFTSPTIQALVGPAARVVIVTQPSATAISGQPFAQQPVLQITDKGQNPVPTPTPVGVTARIVNPFNNTLLGTATVFSDANGVVTFTNLGIGGFLGGRQLGFANPGLDSALSNNIQVGTGPATSIVILQGNNQSAAVGTNVPTLPTVRVVDQFGNGVPNTSVTFTPRNGTNVLVNTASFSTPQTIPTNGNGGVSVGWQLAQTIGTDSLQVTSGSLTGSPLYFVATATAAAPSKYVMVTQPPATAQSGVAISPAVTVRLVDFFGNPTTGASGFTVNAGVTGGGAVGGTISAVTDASGLATFSNLIVSGQGGPKTLTFNDGSHAGVNSSQFQLTGGQATKLAIVGTWNVPGTTTSAQAFSPQPQIQVLDANNNPVAIPGYNINVIVQNGPSNAIVIGANAVTDATGKATFTGLGINGAAGTYSLQFKESTNTLAPITAPTVGITSAPAARLAYKTQPPGVVTNGSNFTIFPVLQVVDTAGFAVASANVAIEAKLASGAGTLGGGTIAQTNGAGEVTFTTLSITGVTGSRTLRFKNADSSLASPISNPVNVNPGAPVAMTFLNQPPATSISGAQLTTQPGLVLRDLSGNPATTAGIVVTATFNATSGSATLSGASNPQSSNSAGNIFFTDLVLTGTASGTLTFSANGLPSVTSNPITVGPPAVNAMLVAAGAHVAVLPRTSIPLNTIQFKVVDANNAPIAGKPVTFSGSRADCTFSAGPVNSDANGLVSVAVQTDSMAVLGCVVTASAESKTAKAFVTTVPYAATHVWFGGTTGATQSYNLGGNWVRMSDKLAAAPISPSDVIFIPTFNGGFTPVMDADHTATSLILGTVAALDLGTHTLTLTGSVAPQTEGSGSTVNGKVVVSGSNVTVTGNFDQLQIGQAGSCAGAPAGATINHVFATAVTVVCTAKIQALSASDFASNAGSGVSLLTGGSLASQTAKFLGDSLFVGDSAVLGTNTNAEFANKLSLAPTAYLYVNGNATFRGTGHLSGGTLDVNNIIVGGVGSAGYTLDGGSLFVGGNFSQVSGGSGPAFTATADHFAAFGNDAPSAQSISFADPTTSWLGALAIDNDGGISFLTDANFPVAENARSISLYGGTMIVPATKTVSLHGALQLITAPSLVTVNGTLNVNSCLSFIGPDGTINGTGVINEGPASQFQCQQVGGAALRATTLRTPDNRTRVKALEARHREVKARLQGLLQPK